MERSALALEADTSGWDAELEDRIDRLGSEPFRLVLDLTAAEPIDAPALGTLVLALKRAQRSGGELALVCSRPETRELLRLTGLERFFEVLPKRENAWVASRFALTT